MRDPAHYLQKGSVDAIRIHPIPEATREHSACVMAGYIAAGERAARIGPWQLPRKPPPADLLKNECKGDGDGKVATAFYYVTKDQGGNH